MLRDASYHLIGHIGVDLARQFYEASREIVFAGLPGEVERVDGDAVAAETGSRIESLEPERFGLRSVDDFPDIEAHALTEELQFVHQGDIDTAVDVLQDLRHFGRLTGGDRNNLVEDGTVERLECPAGSGVVGAKHFRDGSRGEVRVGWVFAFGRVAYEEFV